ncbi:MAG: CBS domain-containing protein [Gammaproteobacteria bacterium]|nr:CBS domain-containing protein [Gammaproteobacteria bacterium]MDH5801416.1 CBS domain-containing protein [Gammaproteobacteria bacterium]
MSIGDYCNRAVVVTGPNSTVNECAELMRQHHVGSIVVVESKGGINIPIGIVTDRDIVIEVVARHVSPEQITVSDLISRNLIVAREVDGLWETLRRMRNRGIRRIPVVNDENVLVGILTADDCLEILTEELQQLVSLVRVEQSQEVINRTVP